MSPRATATAATATCTGSGASSSRVSLRQDYRGGEKLFVDYAGETVAVKDRVHR